MTCGSRIALRFGPQTVNRENSPRRSHEELPRPKVPEMAVRHYEASERQEKVQDRKQGIEDAKACGD